MRNRGLKNRFDREELRRAWAFWDICLWCGKRGFNAFHHIISPSSPRYKAGDFNSSILNAFPIHNYKCHLYNPELHKLENEKRLLREVLRILLRNGYKLKEKDVRFYRAYEELYVDRKPKKT